MNLHGDWKNGATVCHCHARADVVSFRQFMKYAGLYTAIVTPFRDGKVDYDALQRLIEGQIAGGVTGIVPVGTTGESPTLSHAEHNEVIAKAIEFAGKRCQVIAGTGSNCTEEAISLTREAEKMGADGTLQVCPYYNKPSQEGLYHHFKAVAESTSLPVLLYSIPGRSGIEIAVDTVVRLAHDCPTIVAIKEAGGSVERVNQLVHALPEGFAVLSGDDDMTFDLMKAGAAGVISVASNVLPAEVARMTHEAESGNWEAAGALNDSLQPLFKGCFVESNPIPAKAALAQMGLCSASVRLPLTEATDNTKETLRQILSEWK